MESTTGEAVAADAEPDSSQSWMCALETPDLGTPDREARPSSAHDETPTEPGYGHGV
jgi:hypothetical protein